MPTTDDTRAHLIQAADLCVKCGLCLPHCPTYQVAAEDGESPRGRIAMLDALAADRLSASAILNRHLQQCLGCRACERVCPARVPYGSMIDAGREILIARGMRPDRFAGSISRILTSEIFAPITGFALRGLQRIGLTGYMGNLRIAAIQSLSRLCRLLPDHASGFSHKTVGSNDSTRRKVQLHTGCVSSQIDGRGLRDAVTVLEQAGFDVSVPGKQTCCGAMDQHAGRSSTAKTLAKKNIAAFVPETPVISIASGCAATLLEYQSMVGDAGYEFSKNVFEISRFLIEQSALESLAPQPLNKRVYLHTPCTMRNVLGHPDTSRALLDQIPGCEIVPADEELSCCGAGGTNVIQHPNIADKLGGKLVSAAKYARADILATSNIGCAMHLGGLARRDGLNMEILHPVSLLARTIRR